MISLRRCLFACLLVLSVLSLGCDRKPPSMKNMVMETGRTGDTKPFTIRPGKEMPPEPIGPAAPGPKKP